MDDDDAERSAEAPGAPGSASGGRDGRTGSGVDGGSDAGREARATVRPYDPDRDRDAAGLWELKRGFETGLGEGTGDDGKADRYAGKLTPSYRERWLDWVARCVDENPDCLQVAVVEREASDGPAGSGGTDADDDAGGADRGGSADAARRVGYVFVLPESLAFVWDAAVLNEVYVVPDWRGTGVADALMRAALACAREQDLPLDRMVLDVDRANERARAFYDRYGFTHWGEMVAREL
jgi:ribosomal protein S18 acetylase RimI-like enzyme